jgi:hypothetical protein
MQGLQNAAGKRARCVFLQSGFVLSLLQMRGGLRLRLQRPRQEKRRKSRILIQNNACAVEFFRKEPTLELARDRPLL